MQNRQFFLSLLIALLCLHAPAALRYVNLNSPSPVAPFTNWVTAATNIQDAIDAASSGDVVWVTNGIYQTGGRVLAWNYTNRIVVTAAITLQSVNGPDATVIRGDPGIGPGASRCAYLGGGATLSGFTLADGGTRNQTWPMPISTYWAGGVWCESGSEVLTNCIIMGNAADERAGGVYSGTLIDCEISGNYTGYHGAGAYRSTLIRCRLNSNQSWNYGGGAEGCFLNACSLSNNYAGLLGGGAYQSTLIGCAVLNNNGFWGGGVNGCTLNNCTLVGNSGYEGGGANGSTLVNCALVRNSVWATGGGAVGGTLVNCTLTGNSASTSGGAHESALDNCVLYFNSASAGSNYSGGTLNWCCTTPLPFSGTNNFTADPQLADGFHLSAGSPCLAAGNIALTNGVDIDGEAWLNPPAVGCDQYYSGGATGLLNLTLRATFTNVATGFTVDFTAEMEGHAISNRWDFGDGTVTSNHPWTAHSWLTGGDYPVVFTAYNDSFPAGVSASLIIHVQPALHYVALDSTNPVAPYSTWATAATNIQDAVDASFAGSTVVVSNGVYAIGGRVVGSSCTNRLVVHQWVTVQSFNGPAVTAIEGYQTPITTNGPSSVRCVLLEPNTTLIGFALRNGSTAADFSGEGPDANRNGGGAMRGEDYSSIATNCVMIGNAAAYYGGAACGGTLNNSALTGNWCNGDGGGACFSQLADCMLNNNFAGGSGGGAANCTLSDCSLARNNVFWYGGGVASCTLSNCVLSENVAYEGGGAASSTLQTCVLSSNRCDLNGGAAFSSTAIQCTLVGNSGSFGGGASDGTLTGCTLSNNVAVLFHLEGGMGGAAAYCSVSNCIMVHNSADDSGGGVEGSSLDACRLAGNVAANAGGGAHGGGLNNCIVENNSAMSGGGAAQSSLNNCSLAGNSAWSEGGGAANSTLKNCIVYFNLATNGPNFLNSELNYCCTTTLPTNGIANFTNTPRFVDGFNANFQLQSNSPCINAGLNADAPGQFDFAGNARIAGGTVDVGAYEFPSPASILPYVWAQQFGLPTDGSADFLDADGDGLNNWAEWHTGTNPTNTLSVLKMLTPTATTNGITVSWQSVAGMTYFLDRSTSLAAQPAFSTIQDNLVGSAGVTTWRDETATNAGLFFYRVGVP